MMATSLDGFIARVDHSLDWLMKFDTQGENHGFADFMEKVDVLVMGSNSFYTVLKFGEWPYIKPVMVMSQNMTESDIPDTLSGRVMITRLGPQALMNTLATQGIENAYIDGGAVVQSFLRAGLIDTMKVTIVPVLLGEGIRLFGKLSEDMDFTLERATPHPSGLVDLDYSRASAPENNLN